MSFKTLAEFNQPDPRYANMVSGIGADGTIHLWTLEEQYRLMQPISLSTNIPEEVCGTFDGARNTFVNAWYHYELHTAAEAQCYAALEIALRVRHKMSSVHLPKRRGLAALIESAVLNGWVRRTDYDLYFPGAPNNTINELDLMVLTRNRIAHGEPQLSPWGTVRAFERCAELIERLFATTPDRGP